MADFNQPVLSSLYSDMLNILKERDREALIWMEGSTNTNLPLNAKRWNSSNNYFEKFNGTAWVALTTKYNINVEKIDGCTVNDLGTAVTDLWTASKISTELGAKLNSSSYTADDILTKLKTVDGASSGLDADLLDGLHASSTNAGNSIVARDASGNFSAGTITATLSGKATTATTATNVSGGRAIVQGIGNDYHLGGVELCGNGPANTIFPTIGFNQPALFASSLQLRGSSDFRFYSQGGASYANVTANAFIGKLSGNADTATRLSTTRYNYKTSTDSVVVGELMWKNYGNGHTIFDASNSTTPIGTATNNKNPDNAWTPSYPTLMGFNGAGTFGVRVDSSRYAESATNAGYATTAGRAYPRRSDGADLNFHWSGQGGQPTWLWGGTDGANMYVYNPSNFSVNYANSAGSVSASAVASATAGIGAGAVGSYVFGRAGVHIAFGATLAGSSIHAAGITYAGNLCTGSTLSGTWRCLGATDDGGTGGATLWLRIA